MEKNVILTKDKVPCPTIDPQRVIYAESQIGKGSLQQRGANISKVQCNQCKRIPILNYSTCQCRNCLKLFCVPCAEDMAIQYKKCIQCDSSDQPLFTDEISAESKKALEELRVDCTNNIWGCQSKLKLTELHTHEETCSPSPKKRKERTLYDKQLLMVNKLLHNQEPDYQTIINNQQLKNKKIHYLTEVNFKSSNESLQQKREIIEKLRLLDRLDSNVQKIAEQVCIKRVAAALLLVILILGPIYMHFRGF